LIRLQNLLAVREGTRVFSAYELQDGTRIWIITEADRSVTTTVLFSSSMGTVISVGSWPC
jgi:hypothetical protein